MKQAQKYRGSCSLYHDSTADDARCQRCQCQCHASHLYDDPTVRVTDILARSLNTAQYPSPRAARCSIYLLAIYSVYKL